jgi:MATE family multidrug resistance protein
VNVALALVLIFGRLGFPEMGIEGAGWATVAGSWASALLAVGLLLGKRNRERYATGSGWRPERDLFVRLMKYGGPAGAQASLDVLVFNVFFQLVGRLGEAELGASTLAVRMNMIAFLPTMGLGQAVCILVAQRLGGERPDLAERSAYTGMKWIAGYACVVAAAYLTLPQVMLAVFEGGRDPEEFAALAAIVPGILMCAACFCLADAVNLTFAFALRGAGDTRFVTLVMFFLAWPIMVIPTYMVVTAGGSVYWAWWFATAYTFAMAVCFTLRFRSGKWKAMRVIEAPLEGESRAGDGS